MKIKLFLLSALAVCTLSAEPEKMIFAHYMGCFPVATAATRYHTTKLHLINHDTKNFSGALGGTKNWYLAPVDYSLNYDQSAELEIRRAMRGGINGFAIDAWAGSDGAKKALDHLFAAAERMKVPFYITICLDPSCLKKDPKSAPGDMVKPYADAIKYVLDRHGRSPNLARRNGKPLIFGYASRGIRQADAKMKSNPNPKEWIEFLARAHEEVKKLAGCDLYFHFDMDYMPKTEEAGRIMGKHFDAVGAFLLADLVVAGKYDTFAAIAKGVRESGAEWSQPVWFQYNNRPGSLMSGKGFEYLRACWKMAMDNKSTLIQFVTWNDYGEDTILAPAINTNYTVLDLNKYYIDWWKAGKEVLPEKDSVHVSFRRYDKDCKVFPFHSRRYAPGVLEVITILKEPATVIVPEQGVEYEAPAGISFKQFPLKVGKVSAKVVRGGLFGLFRTTVCEVVSPEEITDKPWREDNSMYAISSNFMDHWKADFGDTPVPYYSENGDIDNDGLPNWFEMYWFGKWMDFSTATKADPDADPNGDGITNLEHYRTQTNPLAKPAAYPAGYEWNMKHIEQKGLSFNPDTDDQRNDVWYYMYKHGKDIGKIPHDGNYFMCRDSHPKVSYAGLMAHFSPLKDPDPAIKYIYGWIARQKNQDGSFCLFIVPRKQAMQVLGWKSPVDGTVDFHADAIMHPGVVNVRLEVAKNGEKAMFSKNVTKKDGLQTLPIDLSSISVRKGDFIYILCDCNESSCNVKLNNLKITLKEITK